VFPSDPENHALLALGGNDPAAALEILEEFRSATRADLALLARCYERRDLESLARQAHRIKGASAMVGAGALARKVMELETRARTGDWAEVRLLLEGMPAALDGLAAVE
jgi:HPt (histidine-containing phosphotransfer) domain-containing protein